MNKEATQIIEWLRKASQKDTKILHVNSIVFDPVLSVIDEDDLKTWFNFFEVDENFDWFIETLKKYENRTVRINHRCVVEIFPGGQDGSGLIEIY